MTALDRFDRELESWLVSESQGGVPAGLHEAVVDQARRTRPRPTWLATIRVTALDSGPGPVGRTAARVTDQPAYVRLAIMAALLAVAMAAAALLAGALLQVRPTGRILVVTSRLSYQEVRPGLFDWAPDWGCASLHQVDARTGTARPLAECADQLSVSPDGRYAVRVEGWDPDSGGTSIVVIDLRDGNETTIAQGPGRRYGPAEWSVDGRWLRWAACEPPHGDCVDVFGSSGDAFRVVDDPGQTFFERQPRTAISLSGAPSGGGGVWVADVVGGRMRFVAEFDDPLPSEAILSPDGRTIAVVAATPNAFSGDGFFRPELWLVDADDGAKTKVSAAAASYAQADELDFQVGVSWSPDGSRLMAIVTALRTEGSPSPEDWTVLGREVLIVSADGSGVVALRDALIPDGPNRGPLWSPDSHFLVTLPGDGRLELLNADGTGHRPLATVPRPQTGYRYVDQLIAWVAD